MQKEIHLFPQRQPVAEQYKKPVQSVVLGKVGVCMQENKLDPCLTSYKSELTFRSLIHFKTGS